MTIDDLLKMSGEMKASDLHLTVGAPAKARVNGEIKSLPTPVLLPPDLNNLCLPIIPRSKIEQFEKDGEIDFSYSIPGVGRYRVNVYRQRGSVAATIRLVGAVIPSADKLGIPDSVRELVHKKRGLVLVTGPTGSGKSTSLACLIDMINRQYAYNIITLEDPVEYLHQHRTSIVNQREVGIDTMSFSAALRAALREDPDVILVGEMRDQDTIATAITAAETGHLVFSTLHTIGAAATIDRIIDVFPPHQQSQIRSQLSMVLEGVVSQQLMPTRDGNGRAAAFEVMLSSPAIRNLIREGKTHQIQGLIQTSRKLGMQTMDDSLYELYVNKLVERDQILAHAIDPVILSGRLFS